MVDSKLKYYDSCGVEECAVTLESITEIAELLSDATSYLFPSEEQCRRTAALVFTLNICTEELRNMLDYMCEHGAYYKWQDAPDNGNQDYVTREETTEGGVRITWMIANNAKEALSNRNVILKNDLGYAVREANTQDHEELLGAIRRDIAADHLAQ